MIRDLSSGDVMNNSKKISCSVLLATSLALAPFVSSAAEDDEALLTLIQLMETDVATLTGLQDPDTAPGLVLVLSGSEMRARGYGQISEVLQHQAGFDLTIDSRGAIIPSVRGIGGTRSGASGKVKILLNGSGLNFVRAATSAQLMRLPLSLVEQIEVIRGPGSALHGEYAYAAVINIVTRAGDTAIGARIGEEGEHRSFGLFNYASDSGINLDIAAEWSSSDHEVRSGEDTLYAIGQGDISLSPAYSNENSRQQFLSTHLSYENSEARLVWNDQRNGDFFGLSSSLSSNSDNFRIINNYLKLDLEHVFEFAESDLKLMGDYLRMRGDFDDILVRPPGYFVDIPPIPAFQFPGLRVAYPDGIRSEVDYVEAHRGLEAIYTFNGLEKHTLLGIASYRHIENIESTGAINLDLTNPNPLFQAFPTPEVREYPGEIATISEGQVREQIGIVLQDEFRPSEQLTLTVGVRFDDYSDVGNATNPRIAAVYKVNSAHTLKFQYAEAFRPPTYSELFSKATVALGNDNINPETIATQELAWIYKTDSSVFRSTLFHSDMNDLIVLAPTGAGTQQFVNSVGAVVQGIELEAEISLSESLRLDGNLSYIDSEDDMTNTKLEGVAEWLANVNVVYQPNRDWSLNFHYNFVDERFRAANDPRPNLDGYETVDVTANVFNVLSPGLTLRVGVSNVLDEDIRMPAPLGSYPDDFPRVGRRVWLEINKIFK